MKTKSTRFFMLLSVILAILLFRECNKNNYKKPTHILISAKEAKQMQSLYLKNQYSYINKGLRSEYPNSEADFTNFTIDLQDLKSYIAYVEKVAKKEHYAHLGFRINLGAKKDAQTNVPYANLYYYGVGIEDTVKMAESIKHNNLKLIPSLMYGDKVLCGGNNGKGGN